MVGRAFTLGPTFLAESYLLLSEDTKTRLESGHGGLDCPTPLIAYVSLQSPFHSPFPQGFHKRTRFTGLPWLLSWPFREAIDSIKHLRVQQNSTTTKNVTKRHKPTALIYLFHTCDSVGVAFHQSIWQHCVDRSLLQTQPGYHLCVNNNIKLKWFLNIQYSVNIS